MTIIISWSILIKPISFGGRYISQSAGYPVLLLPTVDQLYYRSFIYPVNGSIRPEIGAKISHCFNSLSILDISVRDSPVWYRSLESSICHSFIASLTRYSISFSSCDWYTPGHQIPFHWSVFLWKVHRIFLFLFWLY